jgi:hypothetical protein
MQSSTVKVDSAGTTTWYNSRNRRHRLDGPAEERADGYRAWHQNGLYHRLDGPAVETADGDRYWYRFGQLHRLDGPAVETHDGTVEYWITGAKLTHSEFAARSAAETKELTVAEVEELLGYRVKIKS